MTKISNNRWAITEDDFAVRLEFPDLKGSFQPSGFFQFLANKFGSETLVIEPGTRAWFVANGNVVGNLDPGQVTIQSCLEKFKIWQVKQATVVLCRAEDQRFDFALHSIPTREGLLVDIDIRLTIQMDPNGIGYFAESFLGTKPGLSMSELRSQLLPLVAQSVKQATSVLTGKDLLGGNAVELVSSTVADQLGLRMKRYGFRFVQTELVNVHSEQLLERFEKKGTLWGKEQDIEDNVRRLDIKSKIREQHLSDAFNRVETKEEYESFLDGIDTQKLLREEDKSKLLFEFENNREDRESLRDHMVAVLDRERDFELESLNADYDHQINTKSIEQEIELARMLNTKDSQDLIDRLESERIEQEGRYNQRREEWKVFQEKQTVKRGEDWEQLLHQRRKQDVESEVSLEIADRNSRVALIESELTSRLEAEKLETEKRRKEFELETDRQEGDDQFERLQRVQQMNADFVEREARLKAELEEIKDTRASQSRIELIQQLRGASTEELVALADTENAKALADMKSNEAITEVKLEAADQLTKAANDKSDAVAEALKEAMRTQQNVLNAVTGAGASGAAAPTPAPPAAPPPAAPAPPAPVQPAASSNWFLARNGETHGPYSEDTIRSYIASGNVTATDQLCQEGSSSWLTASSIPQFASNFGGGNAPPPPPPPPAS